MAKAKKEAGALNLQALTVIRHDEKEIQPGEKFEIDTETGEWLVRIKSAIKLEEETKDEEEAGKEGAE